MKVIDISYYEEVLDWKDLKKANKFLIFKATQGISTVDSKYKSYIKKCEELAIPYWLYVFLDKGKEVDQVKFLLKETKPNLTSTFVGYVLDIERDNSQQNCIEALKLLKDYKSMLYTQYSQYKKYVTLITTRPSSCAWWESRYGLNNGRDTSSRYPPHKGVDLHQYTDQYKVSYVKGAVDVSKTTGNRKDTFFITPRSSKKEEAKTSTVVLRYQKAYNKDVKKVLKETGKLDDDTKKTFSTILIKRTTPYDGRHNLVKVIQYVLGFKNPDGLFGKNTEKALVAYQSKHNLAPDGKVGPKTLAKMIK